MKISIMNPEWAQLVAGRAINGHCILLTGTGANSHFALNGDGWWHTPTGRDATEAERANCESFLRSTGLRGSGVGAK